MFASDRMDHLCVPSIICKIFVLIKPVWYFLPHSGQRTSVKYAEAAWITQSQGGTVLYKSPAFFH